MKYASFYLSALVMALPLMFTMCGPMYSQRGQLSGVRNTVKTFYQMAAENGENTTPPASYKTRDIVVKPEVVPKCHHGEMDLVNAAMACKSDAPLIITVKDAIAETQVFKFDLTSGQNLSSLLSWFTVPIPRNVAGDRLDIFVCLDGNKNGQCIDEPIVDINGATGAVLQAFVGGQALPAIFCAQMKAGAVLFHSRHDLKDIAGVTSATPVVGATAGLVQESLRNLGEAPANPVNQGEAVTFPVKLVRYDATVCPPPNVRTDGCFVKGTQIALSKDISVPIERLNAGQSVMLADGRFAKITRIIAGPEHKPVVAFETAAGQKVTVTSEHPLLTQTGMKLAKDISIGDQLKSASGQFVTIKAIRTKAYKGKVYNFELAGSAREADHSVIANGLVSGELYLQNLMSGKGRSDNPNILSSTSP